MLTFAWLTTTNNLKILQDCRKILEFRHFIKRNDFDIILINETWYTDNKSPPYSILFIKRINKAKGGIAIYYKPNLYIIIIHISTIHITKAELIAIKVNVSSHVHNFRKEPWRRRLWRNSETRWQNNNFHNLNAKHTTWGNNNRNGIKLYNYVDQNDLQLYQTD